MASSPRVIAEQADVSHGRFGFYSLRLLRDDPGELTIEVSLSIYFRFVANDLDSRLDWTQVERDPFVAEWRRQIPASWNSPRHTSQSGQNISIAFVCDVREAEANTQWQARVMKLNDSSEQRTSAIKRGGYADGYDARFDSNDHRRKRRLGDGTQTAMIHEFGHMLGNPDEYKSESPHEQDEASIMNIGSALRPCHLAHFVAWALPRIDALAAFGDTNTKRTALMSAQLNLVSADSVDAEIAAARTLRDLRGDDGDLYFSLRRRQTGEPVPIDEEHPTSLDELEVVFFPTDGEGEITVWEPKSREALEVLLVE